MPDSTSPAVPEAYRGRGQTLAVNTDTVSQIVGRAADEMARANATEKVSLARLDRVKEVTARYMEECSESGTLPTVRGMAARLGLSRNAVYDYQRHHPDSPFSSWLEDFSDLCAEIMMQAAAMGAVKEVSAIFVSKARAGWREQPTQLELMPFDNRRRFGSGLSTEELAEKYSTLIELDDGDVDDGGAT